MPVLPAIVSPARLHAVQRTGLLESGPDAAFDRLAGLAARLLETPLAFITVVDERRSFWKACIGVPDAGPDSRQNAVEESFCQYVIQAQGPFITADAVADPRVRDNPSVTKLGVAAWAGFPLRSPDGSVLGSFCVADRVPRAWTERQVDILQTLADAASAEVALIDALAEERAAREAAAHSDRAGRESLRRERLALRRAEALARAAAALGEHVDEASVLHALVGATVPDFGIWCAVHLHRSGRAPALVATGHRDPGQDDAIRALDAEGTAWLQRQVATPVVRHGRGERLRLAEEDAAHAAAARLGAEEIVSLPLRVRGQTIGALTVGVIGGAEVEDAAALAALAAQAAVALDNAALYDAQASVAEILQQGLLPLSLPSVEGVDLAVRYRPTGRAAQVGGDFYDVFGSSSRPEQAFVVGDIVGKGAAAATLTSVVRHTLRAAFLHGDDPRRALALANEALLDVAGPERFCTAVYGQLEVSGDEVHVTLVRAGHPPPLVVRAGGAVQAVEPDGMILGYGLEAGWEPATVRLGAGDALVLYTDGAIEFPRRPGADGAQALRALLSGLGGSSARELVEAVEHQAIVLSDGPLRDDLALLVIRGRPET